LAEGLSPSHSTCVPGTPKYPPAEPEGLNM
jgi:hypothetical protein